MREVVNLGRQVHRGWWFSPSAAPRFTRVSLAGLPAWSGWGVIATRARAAAKSGARSGSTIGPELPLSSPPGLTVSVVGLAIGRCPRCRTPFSNVRSSTRRTSGRPGIGSLTKKASRPRRSSIRGDRRRSSPRSRSRRSGSPRPIRGSGEWIWGVRRRQRRQATAGRTNPVLLERAWKVCGHARATINPATRVG